MTHIKLQGPAQGWLAVSGGVDSMAALSFLLRGKRRIDGVVHVNHGTAYGQEAERLVRAECARLDVPCDVHRLPVGTEAEWSAGRREIFSAYPRVMTAHHFDDVYEWYVYTLLRYGVGRITPFQTKTVVHPFRLTEKAALVAYAVKNRVAYLDDPTNTDGSNVRSKLRGIRSTLDEIAPNMRGDLKSMLISGFKAVP